jgi:hypothetical protein
MFFRREKPRTITFEDRLQALRQLGCKTDSIAGGKTRVSRDGFAVPVAPDGESTVIDKPGLLIGDEIGVLTNCGYQMFFRTESGAMRPAQAAQLKQLHAFTEDVLETLGDKSYYNTALGTTSEAHLYDRVENRDAGAPHRVWERP